MNTATPPQHIIVTSTKSTGVSILLTFLFGPLGLFYATVQGALILIFGIPIAGFVLAAIALPAKPDAAAGITLLTAIFAYGILVWPTAILWGALAVRSFNKKLIAPNLGANT